MGGYFTLMLGIFVTFNGYSMAKGGTTIELIIGVLFAMMGLLLLFVALLLINHYRRK